MNNKEEVKLIFSDDIYIEIRVKEGEILVWDRGTGYGMRSMFDALENVRNKIGHTTVKNIRTARFTTH